MGCELEEIESEMEDYIKEWRVQKSLFPINY